MNARHVTSLLQPPQQEAPPPTEEPVIEYKYVPPVSKPWLSYGSEQEVVGEVRNALDQTQGRRLMIAPGCVLPVCVTDEQISTATRAAHEYNV